MIKGKGYFRPAVCAFALAISLFMTDIAAAESEAVHNPVPIPPSEKDLPVENAEEFFVAAPANNILEGALIDRDGNLLFCDISKKSVMRLSRDKKLSTAVKLHDIGVGGLTLHRDGRLFMAALDLEKGKGGILAWSPTTGKVESIVPVDAGYWPNDLVFAPDGGFYFSDFHGITSEPKGGIYYV